LAVRQDVAIPDRPSYYVIVASSGAVTQVVVPHEDAA